MFKVLSQFIDIILRGSESIEKFKTAKSKANLKNLTSSFYFAHASLAQVWICGEDLIHIAENIQKAANNAGSIPKDRDYSHSIWEIESAKNSMRIMGENLRYASSLLFELSRYTALIDPGWQRDLDRMMGGKMNLIDGLAHDLSGHLLHESMSIEDMDSSGKNWDPIRLSGHVSWKPEQLKMSEDEIKVSAINDISARIDFAELRKENHIFREKISKLGGFISNSFPTSNLLDIDLPHIRENR